VSPQPAAEQQPHAMAATALAYATLPCNQCNKEANKEQMGINMLVFAF
jgi:hypothetical protein